MVDIFKITAFSESKFFPYLGLICCFLVTMSCSTPSSRERMEKVKDTSRAHASAYAAEGFTLDWASPEDRPYRAWEFYYKHCTLVSRNPYPNRTEHSCTDPF